MAPASNLAPMPSHAVFLRAVNLGRNRRVTGAELCSLFEDIGFGGAVSFRTSGNVLVDAAGEPDGKVTARIEQALGAALGYEVRVFVRSAAEVSAIAQAQPFDERLVAKSKGKLQVSFLARKPTAAERKKVEA